MKYTCHIFKIYIIYKFYNYYHLLDELKYYFYTNLNQQNNRMQVHHNIMLHYHQMQSDHLYYFAKFLKVPINVYVFINFMSLLGNENYTPFYQFKNMFYINNFYLHLNHQF